MKTSFVLVALSALLLPLSASAGDRAELCVKKDRTTVLTLRFSNNSLAFFDRIPTQLTSVLRATECLPRTQTQNR